MCFGHQTYSSSNPRSIANLCMHVCMLSHFSRVQLIATSWTIAHQALLSMGFSRQEHQNMLPCSSPGDLPSPGIEPMSLTSPVLAGRFFTTSTTWKAHIHIHIGFPGGSDCKESVCKAGDLDLIPGLGMVTQSSILA